MGGERSIEIKIMGQMYSVKTDGNEEHLQEVA